MTPRTKRRPKKSSKRKTRRTKKSKGKTRRTKKSKGRTRSKRQQGGRDWKNYLRLRGPPTNHNIHKRVRLWQSNPAEAENKYGHISNWDVSQVTDMQSLFAPPYGDISTFNDDINDWDVSNVTNMGGMFIHAKAFNSPIDTWDVSNVTNMHGMFSNAQSFNQVVGGWDVSNVTSMQGMFANARAFDKYIGGWEVSNVAYMQYMFANARVFNHPIDKWDVSNVINMEDMFSQSGYTYPKPQRPMPPPVCMSDDDFNKCDKNDEGVPECGIMYNELTKKTAVMTHPPPINENPNDTPNTTVCYDRASMRQHLETSSLNPNTRQSIDPEWINANMGTRDCVEP